MGRITTWREFTKKVRKMQEKLLVSLSDFRDPILVTGCQGSGSTLLSRTIMSAKSLSDYRRGGDSELEGALILSGRAEVTDRSGRFCFQTTYLNECYREYFEHAGRFKLIFVIRDPESAVHAMCHHWGNGIFRTDFALNELYQACGANRLPVSRPGRRRILGRRGISRLDKACLAYVGKTSQLFELIDKIKEDVMVVDFEEMFRSRFTVFPRIYTFLGLPQEDIVHHPIRLESIYRARLFSHQERLRIREICGDTYERARKWAP